MSSSSRKKPTKSPSKPTKRHKVEFGQPNEDDERDVTSVQTQSNLPSASGWSTRKIHATGHVPSLAVICARVFAQYFRTLATRGNGHWDSVKAWLAILPESQVPRVFAALRATCPGVLTNLHMTYFLRGASITLSDELPGVGKNTLALIGQGPSEKTLRELHLNGFAKIEDGVFGAVVAKLSALEILDLRVLSSVAQDLHDAGSIEASRNIWLGTHLVYASSSNLSYLPYLQTDATVSKMFAVLNDDMRLPNVKNLKLRQTMMTDTTINQFLLLCPNLRRLDLSFTAVRHPPLLLSNQSLEKLSLTSTQVSGSDLLQILGNMPDLRTLSLGALGAGQGMTASISNSSAMTMNDQLLRDITDILENYAGLDKISLVGNSKLGITSRKDGALADFVRRAGRRCTVRHYHRVLSRLSAAN
ncbi:hypothetical protein EUX98_g39 [Antrodiella citrinella]|uniref:F-box domain-containing protein n=1 Tax=Antrodiella citrinella TaxID=2447956 RepID=A0A4S4NDN5_9APHY|nr:hypothetical protein EUX98_g39 [Antrodiella citrinella]